MLQRLLICRQIAGLASEHASRGRVTHTYQRTCALAIISSKMILEAKVKMLPSIDSAIDARFARKRTFRLVSYNLDSCHYTYNLTTAACRIAALLRLKNNFI